MEPVLVKGKYVEPTLAILAYERYRDNNALCVHVLDAKSKARISTISVNIGDESALLGDDAFWGKNYSENEGILDSLVDAGVLIIHDERDEHFVKFHLCQIVDPDRWK